MPGATLKELLAVAMFAALSAGAAAAQDGEAQAAKATARLTAANADDFLFDTPLHPQTMKSGGTLTDLQRAYDVRHYGLALDIDPEKQSIAGEMAVRFRAVADLETLELDLDPRLEATGATMAGAELGVERDEDKIRIALPAPMTAGETATVTVAYGGQPYVAERPPWRGGFVWSQTKAGHPWAATAVQGRGCDLWRPCKDHFADKPDEGVDLIVSVPAPLRVASNGVLVSEETKDGRTTAHWRSRHRYTGYAIALNVGPYKRIKDELASPDGRKTAIEFWALPENAKKARALIDTDAKPHLAFFEDLLGPYPWRDEKMAFVETPHLGMEHQTINAYGEGYKRGKHGFDGLLHHELAHEWFGNLITHTDAKDVWLHEGYASYMQALYAERLIGEMAYADIMYGKYLQLVNCDPVVQPEKKTVRAAISNGDVYTKGSWMLHTLRSVWGDDLFLRVTRRLLYGAPDPWVASAPIEARFRSTEDFIRILSDEAGEDMAWFVEAYLHDADLPTLEVRRTDEAAMFKWRLAKGRAFPMPVPATVNGEPVLVAMTDGVGRLELPAGAALRIDPKMKALRRLPVIGSCEEQMAKRRKARAERAERQAKEYGWTRSLRLDAKAGSKD